MKTQNLITALLLSLSLLFTACGSGGGDDSSSTTSSTTTTPTSTAGTSSLVVKSVLRGESQTTDNFINTQCGAVGGIAIYSGIDTNKNGTLDIDERSGDPQVVCNGGTIADFSVTELSQGDDHCNLGGIALIAGTQTQYFCNQAVAVATDFTKTSTVKGSINLSSAQSAPSRAPSRASTNMQGGLWFTPAKIKAAIEADINAKNPAATKPIPEPIVKPIAVTIDSDNNYEIPDVPSGEYSLVYIDEENHEGTKIDDIYVAPDTTVVQDITETKATSTVSLRVSSLQLGSNIENATVRLNELDKTTLTSADGTAEFRELPEGTYSITVSKNGFVSKYLTFRVLSGTPTDLQAVELNSQKGELSGMVTADNVDDFANIIVYAKAADGSLYTALTNASGSYKFPALPVGDGYSILAYAHDFESSKVDNITINNASTSSAADIHLTQLLAPVSLDTAVPDAAIGGTISGYARFADINATLEHAGIIASIEGTDYEAITARDGSFIFKKVPAGEYTVNFTDSNHLRVTTTIHVLDGAATYVDDIKLQSLVGTLSGVVKDSTSQRVANATILLQEKGLTTQTDNNGTFTFSNIPVGLYLFQVQKDGYSTTKFEAELKPNETTEVGDKTITKQVLLGRVSKGEGATDHSGIAINVLNEGLYAVSASDGNFSINGIPSKEIVLELSADGFKTLVLSFNPATEGFTLPLQTLQSAKITDSSLSINSGAAVTNNRVVNLTIGATSAYQMLVSETLDFVNASLIDYVSSYDFNLTSSGDGYKNVYVKLYDASGSEATSKIVNAAINLDTTPLRLDAILLQTGTAYTNTQDIIVKARAIDSEQIALIKIYDSENSEYKLFNYNENGIAWRLPSAESQELKVILVDSAGNAGDESVRQIIFDTTAPVIDSVSVVGKHVTNDIATLLLTTESIDYNRVEVSMNANFSFAQQFAPEEDIAFHLSGEDGSKTLYIRTLDEAGNLSETKSVTITYDTTIPTKPELAVTNGFTNRLNYDVEISKKSTDTNFEGYDVSLNGADWVRIENSADINSIALSLAASQLNTIKVRGVDKAGNYSLVTTSYITHDENALVTKPSPVGGFFNESVTVTLSALNDTDIYYTTDGSEPTTASTLYNSNLPIVFDTDGAHTLKYFTRDADGNEELVKTSIYKLDTIKPVVSFDTHQEQYGYYPDLNVTVDDASQVAIRYEIANDGAAAPTPTAASPVSYSSIPVAKDGTVVKVTIVGVDEAGNESDPVETTLRVDTQKPTVSSDDNGGTYPAQNGKLITLTALDVQDQDPKIFYTLDGTEPTSDATEFNEDINLSAVGTYTLKAIAIDDLGNRSQTIERAYRLSTIYDASNNQITSDITWTKENSPYSLESRVTLSNGATLTIEAGVEVILAAGVSLDISDGTLLAIGTTDAPIKFLGMSNSSNSGVKFFNNSVDAQLDDDGEYVDGSTIQNAIFKDIYSSAITVNDASPYFKNITINNVDYALQLFNTSLKALNIDINATRSDAIYAHGATTNATFEAVTIKNYSSNAIEAFDSGCRVNITKSDIEYVDDLTMLYSRTGAIINATQNNFHTYNLDLLDSLVSSTGVTYAPMLSTIITVADFDEDGILDVDDNDDDNDGYTDSDEAAAHTSQFLATGVGLPDDFDDDNISDVTDLDDDNDGFSDIDELAVGANPKDANSTFEIVNAQELSVDTTLPQADDVDTLLLKGNVIIPLGKTLTIKAGTKIIMGGNYSFQVHGAIKLEGSESAHITMTPKLPSSEWEENHFDGFIFYSDATPLVTDADGNYVSGSLIQYSDISYGGSVVATLYKTDDTSSSAFAYLQNVTIDHSKRTAVYVKNLSQCYMKNTHITNSSNTAGDATIYAENADLHIIASSISQSYAESIHLSNATLDLKDSNFTDNTRETTIFTTNSTITSKQNHFINNKTVFYIYNSSELTSEDDTIDGVSTNRDAAITINNNSLATITRVAINNSSSYGIYAYTSKLVTLIDANISNTKNSGFYTSYGSTIITGTTLTNNKNGIEIYAPFFAKVEKNNLTLNSEYGLLLREQYNNGRVYIAQNSITENGLYGIKTEIDAKIEFNTLKKNSTGGIYLSGVNATPTLQYNNIYENNTTDDGDNIHYDIMNNNTVDFVAPNNYFGTTEIENMAYHTYDKLDQSDRGRIYFDNYLNSAVDIINKTSQDFDGDGIMDIYDGDDDDDNITDRVETDTNNGQLDPYADNSDDDITDIDTDRDGLLDADDNDDDNDGLSDDDEATRGTDPKLADSDDDGVSDADELTIGSDPLVKDILSGILAEDYDVTSDMTVYNLELLAGVKLYSSTGATLTLASKILVDGATIQDLNIDANTNRAFEVRGDSSFKNLKITNATEAIYLNTRAKTLDIENLSITDGGTGIYYTTYADYSKLRVTKSYFANLSEYGIRGASLDKGLFELTQSDFNNVNRAIYYYGGGSSYSYATVKISNNIFRNNSYGVYSLSSMTEESYLSNNTFDSNEYAINYVNNGQLRDNLYTNNQFAYSTTPSNISHDYIANDNPYVDKYMEDFNILDAHEAETFASDGGEVGVYGGNGASFVWLGRGISSSVTAASERTISGELTINQYWDANTTLEGNLIIPRGNILKIAAGAEIHVPDGNSITINGEIYSEGTSGNEIVFSPDGDGSDTTSGQWSGIIMNSVGASLKNAIIKYATDALTLTNSIGTTIAYVTVVNPSQKAIIAGKDTTIEDSTLIDATEGIYSAKGGLKVKRNFIANMSEKAIYIYTMTAEIDHNILSNNNQGIVYTGYSDKYEQSVKYNTIVDTAHEALNYAAIGDIRFNIFADNNISINGPTTTYNNYYRDISVNAISGSETADYDGGVSVNPKAKYADNSETPDFANAVTLTASDVVDGGYAGIYNITPLADYRVGRDSYKNYSEIGSELGAYNIITAIDADTTTYASQRRVYKNTFMKNGDSLEVNLYAASADGVCDVDISAIDSTQSTISCEKNIANPYMHSFSFTIDATNERADGSYAIETKVTTAFSDETLSDANTSLITLDNTGATVALDDFTNDSNITQNRLVHLNIDDGAGIGAASYEYSFDGGSSWNRGESHIELKSGGGDLWNIGSIKIDGEIVVEQKLGFNLIELNTTNFSKTAEHYFAADDAGLQDFKEYLYDLEDGSLIAFVVKNNGYYNSNSFIYMMQELRKFGFSGDFDAYDSVAFIGYKGVKSSQSITKIIANRNNENDQVAELNPAEESGLFNAAVILDTSCYNDDGEGNCNVKVRATDYLGNTGDVFDINYSVDE